jgi:colanic acid/amylovoran biosynthesis glycosyltransferase
VLHSTPHLGELTERWIDIQAESADRYGSRLIGNSVAAGATPQPYWLDATSRLDARAAYGLMFVARGLPLGGLALALRSSKPSVVHVHYGLYGAQHIPLARRLHAPLVTSFYGYDATQERFTREGAWRRRYARLFAGGDAFLAEGPAMAGRIEALGCPVEKVHVIRLPADARGLERVDPQRADIFTVAMGGRFTEKKGFDTGIRAFAHALRGHDARLLLVGGGELEDQLRAVTKAEGIEAQTEFAGRLPFTEFMSALGGAHLTLHPSRTAANGDSEGGAPVTLFESQWLGVPALVSDHDDLPFVVGPDSARVLDPHDVGAWADQLLDLYNSPAELDRMGQAAASFARDNHSPEANTAARETLYDTLRKRG